jgi:hypothetical protein
MKKPKTKGTCMCEHCSGAPQAWGRHPADPTGEVFGDHHWPLPMAHECVQRGASRVTLAGVAPVQRVAREAGPATKYTRPPEGTTTARVWSIADRLAEQGTTGRREIIAACVEAGINVATAGTQYSKWKGARAA